MQRVNIAGTPRACVGKLGALLFCVLSGSGCYRYVPTQLSQLQPSEDVKVRITESALQRLIKDFSANTTELEGQISAEGPDSVSLSVQIARQYQGITLENVRQTLFLGRTEVVEVRRRELSRSRTALAAGGALAVFVVLVNSVIQQGDPDPPGEDPPPPPPGIRAVLFRIPTR